MLKSIALRGEIFGNIRYFTYIYSVGVPSIKEPHFLIMSKNFYHVPSRCEVYAITPDCEDCTNLVVVYGGPIYEVQGYKDEAGTSRLKSWQLQCFDCDPQLQILPVSAEFYQEKYQFVMQMKEQLTRQNAA